jgi:hypothetical protein
MTNAYRISRFAVTGLPQASPLKKAPVALVDIRQV